MTLKDKILILKSAITLGENTETRGEKHGDYLTEVSHIIFPAVGCENLPGATEW